MFALDMDGNQSFAASSAGIEVNRGRPGLLLYVV
jgi:hypothetical protein